MSPSPTVVNTALMLTVLRFLAIRARPNAKALAALYEQRFPDRHLGYEWCLVLVWSFIGAGLVGALALGLGWEPYR